MFRIYLSNLLTYIYHWLTFLFQNCGIICLMLFIVIKNVILQSKLYKITPCTCLYSYKKQGDVWHFNQKLKFKALIVSCLVTQAFYLSLFKCFPLDIRWTGKTQCTIPNCGCFKIVLDTYCVWIKSDAKLSSPAVVHHTLTGSETIHKWSVQSFHHVTAKFSNLNLTNQHSMSSKRT